MRRGHLLPEGSPASIDALCVQAHKRASCVEYSSCTRRSCSPCHRRIHVHCCRAAARADEELSPYLPPSKRLYVFGALAPQAARFVMWLLPELKVRSGITHCTGQAAAPAHALLSWANKKHHATVKSAHPHTVSIAGCIAVVPAPEHVCDQL